MLRDMLYIYNMGFDHFFKLKIIHYFRLKFLCAINPIFLRVTFIRSVSFFLCSANTRSRAMPFWWSNDFALIFVSGTRPPETDRRAQHALTLAFSWFNLHLARPFALLVTGCLSIIPFTPLRNLNSTQRSLFSLSPLAAVGRVGRVWRTPFCCFIFRLFFWAHENCEVYRGDGTSRELP